MSIYSPPELYEQFERTARKQHKCSECARVIEPGDKYELVKGKWDGEFDTFKTCKFCLDLFNFVRSHTSFEFAHGTLTEDIEYAVHDELLSKPEPGFEFGVMRRMWAVENRRSAYRGSA